MVECPHEPREHLVVPISGSRQVGYAEYGDPRGTPVLFCHGFPGSRLEARHIDGTARALGVRLIAPDRPGIGTTTQHWYDALAEWAEDGLAFAGELGLEKFAVLGVSGGGPYALALAWAAPDAVRRAAVVGSPSPIDEGVLAELRPLDRAAVRLGRRSVRSLRLVVRRLVRRPLVGDRALWWAIRGLDEVDLACVATDRVAASLEANYAEATRSGTAGLERDGLLYTRPWGFPLGEVGCEVDVWHGALDRLTPVVMARRLYEELPRATAFTEPGEGHFSLLHVRGHEILERLRR